MGWITYKTVNEVKHQRKVVGFQAQLEKAAIVISYREARKIGEERIEIPGIKERRIVGAAFAAELQAYSLISGRLAELMARESFEAVVSEVFKKE